MITVSNANARHIASAFGVSLKRIRVIPCGVDIDFFKPAEFGGFRVQRSTLLTTLPLIVCVARQVPVKNLRLLLEVCALLRARAVKFHLVLVGDGPMRKDLERMLQPLGLEDCVEFTGALEQRCVLGWWQRASVAVLTSENEGMPVCLMEAAACGIPAVATAVGGVPELILNGRTGLLVPPGDATALAAALQTLLQDAVLAHRMGDAARKHAEGRFSVRAQVDRLLALWAELLQSRFARSTTSGNAQAL